MNVLAASLVAAVALGVGVGCGSKDSGNNSGNTPARPAPVSAEEAQRWADCLDDIKGDRDSDDPREAAADDDCLDVYESVHR
jgi:hypothetical protein